MADVTFADPEAATFWRFIASSLDRLVALAAELPPDGLDWRPPTPDTNSVYALTVHTLGNAEENILQTLCGRPIGRDRDAEFAQSGTAAGVLARWRELRPRLEAALARLPAGELARERAHPRRGTISGRAVLLVVARHAAEHLGQAELTRDLWRAARQATIATKEAED